MKKSIIIAIILTALFMIIAFKERGYLAIGGEMFIGIIPIVLGVEYEARQN